MRRSLALAVVLLGAGGAVASAHGPCGCTSPALGTPGDELVTGPAYLIVWNPERDWLAGPAGPAGLSSAHRADAPSEVVMLRERVPYPARNRRGRFTIPRATPPGLYLVLVFDGSEGGQHATWDYVHVLGDPSGDATAATTAAVPPLLRALREVLPPL